MICVMNCNDVMLHIQMESDGHMKIKIEAQHVLYQPKLSKRKKHRIQKLHQAGISR